jgi:tetratricopeptide (TPR) repeat protein
VLFAAASVANVLKVSDMALSSFGTGVAWWFPERAAAFVERENLPGEIISGYAQGGYLIWRLGPKRRDYIDGRAIPFGPGAILHHMRLFASPPDSPVWQSEADRYNISIILLPINRFQSEVNSLGAYCNSKDWKLLYLDQVGAVFVRRTAETEELVQQSGVDCATVPLPPAVPEGSASERFNQWINAAVVLSALGRNREALVAAEKARKIFPESGLVPWLRGNIAYSKGMFADAEQEYRQAVANDSDLPLFWFSLATVYKHQGRIPETIAAERKAIEQSTLPQPYEWLKLARLYLDIQQPKMALATFDEAERVASPDILGATGKHNFRFDLDQGRAAAWRALGNTTRAAVFSQKAVQDLVPTN